MMTPKLCSWIQDPPFMETCSGEHIPDIGRFIRLFYIHPITLCGSGLRNSDRNCPQNSAIVTFCLLKTGPCTIIS